MKAETVLRQAGLAGNEVKVYLALIDLGSSKAGEITKQSGVNRTNVYDALDKLMEKGLASFTVSSNRKFFEAASPQRLIHYLDELGENLKKKKQNVLNILPEIENRKEHGKATFETTVFKGIKGIKSIAEDILKTGKTLQTYGAQGSFMKRLDPYAKLWHRMREKQGLIVKIIYSENIRKEKDKLKYRGVNKRYTNLILESPSSTWIYGDNVAIVVWSQVPVATLIRNKDVAQTYKHFFEVLWNNSTP